MESFLNKLKSTVSEVLPGNPLGSHYDIQDRLLGSAGPNMAWKIYRATKKTTKENACVFVFDKRDIEKLTKDDKKQIISSLRRGIQQLTKLRHPKILSVVHPIEENRDCLAFATEPVLMSLANLLELHETEQSEKLDELEIKYGLTQVLEALSFLHGDVKLTHGNIHPSSILLNDLRCWKLAGFDFFTCDSPQGHNQPMSQTKEWCSGLSLYLQPALDYLAPEYGSGQTNNSKSDMYSLGVTVHALYNQGKPVYQCHDSLTTFKTRSAEMRTFRQSLLRNIPQSFHESFKSLLSYDSLSRLDAKSLLKTDHLQGVSVMTLVYLDSLVQRDNLQKSQYFKSLPAGLKQMSVSLCLHRVLPVLFSECANREMIPFALQNIIIIAEKCSKQQYQELLFPRLIPILSISEPMQIPLILLRNMPLLLSKTSDRDTRKHILPMLFTSIELQNPQLQLRLKCLISIGKMLTHLDKWFVLDEVLPFVQQVPSKEPSILMAILGIYKITFSNKDLGIPKDHLALKSLPFLIPLSVDHTLSKQQFTSYMDVIKEMLSTVQRDHLLKLKDLELQQKDDSSLQFSAGKSSEDSAMQSFLSEAGVMTAASTKMASSILPKSSSNGPIQPLTPPQQPQVKNLTSTLTPSLQPVKPSNLLNSVPLRPTSSQFPLSASPLSANSNLNCKTASSGSILRPASSSSTASFNSSTVGGSGAGISFAGQPALNSVKPLHASTQIRHPISISNVGFSRGAEGTHARTNVNTGWSFNSTNYQPQAALASNCQTLVNTSHAHTPSTQTLLPPKTMTLTESDINDLLG
ncbi:SCY1-like protein 2 isoform X2 [Watersipora subatra]|uniref:SCY1-like protein 2 isoform X2 n=1 Tax=Watersipora subatra TaxID=2589382 RepID=UPI00355C7E8A